MPEPFKNMINSAVITAMASQFKNSWPAFDDRGFIATASNSLDALELKARTDQVTEAMIQHLPDDFIKAGGYRECPKVSGKIARIAAETILDIREKAGK